MQIQSGQTVPLRQNFVKRVIATQRGFDIGRVQSCVLRLSKILTPPLPLASVSSPCNKGGGYTLAGRRGGWGGQYFGRRKTQDWPLTVIISLRSHLWRCWWGTGGEVRMRRGCCCSAPDPPPTAHLLAPHSPPPCKP
jgi:hypothetical protein